MDVKTKFRMKLLLSFSGILCTIGLSMFFMVSFLVKDLLMDNLNRELDSYIKVSYSLLDEQYPGKWRADGDKLYKGTMIINGDSMFVDKMKEQTGTITSLFLDNTTVATNVTKDGKRSLNTSAQSEVVTNVLKQGLEFSGSTEIGGTEYVSRYLPIKDESNKVIGMWFVGVEYSTIKSRLTNINLIVGGIILVLFVASVAAINYFTNGMVKNKVIFSRGIL